MARKLLYTTLLLLIQAVWLAAPAWGQATADSARARQLYDATYDLLEVSTDTAWQKTLELLAFAEKTGYARGRGMALDLQGNILRMQGDYVGAVSKHFEALHIYDSLKFTAGYRTVLVNTGSDYMYMQNYPKAIEYYKNALSLTDTADYRRQVIILNNIGNVYQALGWYDSAIAVYTRARPYADADTTLELPAVLYSSLGIVYGEKKDFATAIPIMLKALSYQQKAGDKNHYASSSSTLAGYYIEMGEYAKAAGHLEEAYRVAVEIQAKSIIANYYRNKSLLMSRLGKHKEAYEWLEKYTILNDSLINEQHIAQLAETEARFGIEKKNRELALLNADKALKESELKRQSLWKYGLILLVLAMAAVLFFMYRLVQVKKQVNRHLEDENTQMQKENILAQYETLRTQVNPHFLFNSLNALSSLIKQDAERAVEFTGVFSRLYRNVLELKDHTVITLAEELRLVDDFMYLQKIRFQDKLILEKNIPAGVLHHYIPPFCLQMLIENAIKHNIISEEKHLTIRLYTEEGWLVLSNTLQPRPQKQESTGTGIRNITARFKYIHNAEPLFYIVNTEYIAKIPLIPPQE